MRLLFRRLLTGEFLRLALELDRASFTAMPIPVLVVGRSVDRFVAEETGRPGRSPSVGVGQHSVNPLIVTWLSVGKGPDVFDDPGR